MLSWPAKDPDEELDYRVDWSGRLTADTIDTSEWIVPAGLTKMSEENTTTTATVWLSGGTRGTTYEVVNRVTTSGGRTMDQTVRLSVEVN